MAGSTEKDTAGYCQQKDVAAVLNNITQVCDCTPFEWYGDRCDIGTILLPDKLLPLQNVVHFASNAVCCTLCNPQCCMQRLSDAAAHVSLMLLVVNLKRCPTRM